MTNVYRIGEVQDDYCTSCHLLLSHDIASVVNGEIAKTTCRTCFNTHDYKHGKIPKRPAKKAETKQSLMDQVLRSMPQMPAWNCIDHGSSFFATSRVTSRNTASMKAATTGRSAISPTSCRLGWMTSIAPKKPTPQAV